MVALSAATRECIFLLRLIKDAQKHNINLNLSDSKLHCRVLEDNQGTIAIADEPRIRPRTKHINTKYWHFTEFMRKNKGILSIHWISTKFQLADIFTKPLGLEPFVRFARKICGWLTTAAPLVERECGDMEVVPAQPAGQQANEDLAEPSTSLSTVSE